MRRPRRRGSAVFAAAALVGSLFAVLGPAQNALAGTAVVTNACFSNATATYSDLDFTFTGTDSADPITFGVDTVDITGASFEADVPADLLVSGYNLGLLTVGANNIPATVYVAREATGAASAVDVQNFVVNVVTTITDPDGTPGTGDETATPLNVNIPLNDWLAVAPTSGGTIEWQQAAPGSLPVIPGVGAGGTDVTPNGSVFISASVAGGLIQANFDCQPGTTDPLDDTTFTPNASPAPFETTTVNAPPAPPVANDDGPGVGPWGNAVVGATQSVPINVLANDFDQNNDIDPTSVAAGTVAPSGGSISIDPVTGVITYTNTDPNVDADPGTAGQQDTFSYTVDDLQPATSNEATVTVNVLANACTASPSCSLNQILTAPVLGDVLSMEQNQTGLANPTDKDVLLVGVVDPAGGPDGIVGNDDDCVAGPVVLNGQPQVACGLLNDVTVTNARGTDAGWSLTGQVTDFSDGTIPGNTCPADTPASWNNHCIPGDNLGWFPTAVVSHFQIPGDVAAVDAGSDLFPATPLTPDLSGLGLESAAHTLCSTADNVSGGTFTCGAGLALGVPASAAQGNYSAVMTLTLA